MSLDKISMALGRFQFASSRCNGGSSDDVVKAERKEGKKKGVPGQKNKNGKAGKVSFLS